MNTEQIVTSVPGGVDAQEETEMVEEVYELHVEEDGQISATPTQVIDVLNLCVCFCCCFFIDSVAGR